MVFRVLRPDSVSVWKNKEIIKRFSRYKGIIDNTKIARYILARTLQVDYDESDSIEDLEKKLKYFSNQFQFLLAEDSERLEKREVQSQNYITLAYTLAKKYLESCIFCERECKVNRIDGKKGYCLIGKDSFISSAFLHMGEEAPIIPSGTIFFLGCNFGCVFCQNFDISQSWKKRREPEDIAKKVNNKALADLAESLFNQGALNINYVGGDPIPNIHTIVGSLLYQKSNVTQLWNSNFFLTDNALSLIIDLIDVWLPDWKYGNNDCGKKYSGIENYFDVISRNHKRIHDEGSGEIIIRHLVMPNHIDCCSKPFLDYVSANLPKAVVNIMGQYRPQYKISNYPEIDRRPTSEEMREVKNYAEKLNILYKPVS
ncbi:MAG: radical SAM protein [Promethearchaeota archaeon]